MLSHGGVGGLQMTESTPGEPNAPGAVKQPERPKLLSVLGPGLITGASDDDPSGIATYSQAGAQFGYDLGWTLVLSWPLMCAIQEISARIGRVTGRGIAGNLKKYYPNGVVYSLVGLLVIANTINLGADLGAMAAALKLVIGGPQLLYVALFGLVSVLLEVFVRYSRYVSVLKWLTLSLFAYVGVALVVHIPWGTVAFHLAVPNLSLKADYFTVVGGAMNFTHIDPIKALFWSAVINGVVAVPVMAMMMRLSSNREAMGQFRLPLPLKVLGWVGTGVMAVAAIGMFATMKVGS